MPRPLPIAALAVPLAASLVLAGCATTPRAAPIDVTRYHLGDPLGRGSIEVTQRTAFAGASPEDDAYDGAVAAELARLGFAPGTGETDYVALVAYKHSPQGFVDKPPPVSIGIGTANYGRHGGVGVGGSVGIGGKRYEVIETELSVEIKRRADGTVVWEGRAVGQALAGTPASMSGALSARLAQALFKGFPGESGITIRVK